MADEADLYKAPSFQFYPTDFIADTCDLTNEEVGAYMRLLCRQWMQGSVPSDMASLGRICGGEQPKRMAVIWKMLSRFFKVHDSIDGQLIQGRMEEVRAKALEHHNRRVNAGRDGGKAKAESKQIPSNAKAKPKSRPSNARALRVAKAKQNLALRSPVSGLRDSDSLRSSAEKVPKEPKALASLADEFSGAFGNCQTTEAKDKHRVDYADFLAICHSRDFTVGQAAEACAIAREMNGGKPLFAGSVKRAISYLPGRGNLRPVPSSPLKELA